ncbi:hypothetical protein K435DRAFT_854016 [Dendrothele bispora CBS 962.96]|uniref:Uncharacterized protein n=1 Tax=Dendrothele bispora (strain CBS 962.96) TaxID=1314807 RepID=A0A4S8MFC9_DENBC|nr:hypothetical protein K435DRAFT_854016 [Dendrothele bispora CBS 962.96]
MIPKEQQKKRGAPSYFAGAPLKLLFQHLQGYIDSHGNREQFWAKFNVEWHKKYPPNLTSKEGEVLNVNDEGVGAGVDEDVDGDNTERPLLPLPPNYPPVPYLPLPPNYPPVPYPPIDASNTTSSSPTAGANDLSLEKPGGPAKGKEKGSPEGEEEEEGIDNLGRTKEENALIARAASNRKLDSWFANYANKEKNAKRDQSNIVHSKKKALAPPRIVAAHKVYESHPDYREKVAKAVREECREPHSGFDREQLNKHAVIAKRLFEAEDAETQDKIRAEAKAEYQELLDAYEKGKEGGGDLSAKAVKRSRAELGAMFYPLMEYALKVTNTQMSLTIIGEGDTEGALFLSSVLTGHTPGPEPKKFNEWDPVGFKMSHIKSFSEFVKCCVRLENGLQVHPPQYSGAIPCEDSEDTPIPYSPSPSPPPNVESQPGPSAPKGKKRKVKEKSSKRSKRRRRGGEESDEVEWTGVSEGEEEDFGDDTGETTKEDEDELSDARKGKGKKKGKGKEKEKEKEKERDRERGKGKGKEKEKGKGKGKETEHTRPRSTRLAAANATAAATKSPTRPVNEPDNGNDMDVDVSAGPISTSASLPLPTNANESIRTLRTYLLKLPDTLEDGQDVDELAQHCYQEGPWADMPSNGDALEHWNGILDMMIQKRTMETMEAYQSRLVKRGPKGTEALYRVLAHVTEKVVVVPDMLDGKIGRVIDAIKGRCPEITVSEPTPPNPNLAESSSSPLRRRPRPPPIETLSEPGSSSHAKRPLETGEPAIDHDTKPSWVISMEEYLLPDIDGNTLENQYRRFFAIYY